MNITSALFAFFATLVGMATIWLVKNKQTESTLKARFETIDGLRGYLAFFVFLHHSVVNYVYLKTGVWESPDSNLYSMFGYGSVQLFFMITSFLFFNKLLNDKQAKIDWPRFYVARLLRLYPLYLFSVVLIMLIIALLSKGNLQESYWELFKHVVAWLVMCLFGIANVNEVQGTNQINAGVAWSLSYEWIFYLAMPIFALLLKKKTTILWLIFSIAGVSLLAYFHRLLGGKVFLGGMIAAYLFKNEKFRQFAVSDFASLIVIVCCMVALGINSTDNSDIIIVGLTIAFILIACGNNLFGALTHRISINLGDLSYSIYLLHGILLICTFNLLIDKSINLSPILYWCVIMGITPILILICHLTYQYIENPTMKSTDRVMSWLKRIGNKSDGKIKNYSA